MNYHTEWWTMVAILLVLAWVVMPLLAEQARPCTTFIAKPFDIEVLLTAVGAALGCA